MAINQNIPTKCTMEDNLKAVNTIYLNHLQKINDSTYNYVSVYDSTEIPVLENVAYQNPLKGGSAVYMARAMLFIDVIDEGYADKRLTNKPQQITNTVGNYNLYPNPNNGAMQLSYSLAENETGYLTITNVLGEKISTYPLVKNGSTLNITETKLVNGVYFYKVIVNDKIVKSNKLVISK